MPAKWFVLKDDSAGADLYTPLLAALHTVTAAKRSGAVVQSVRTCGYDSTVKLVKANILDAERTGAQLGQLARDQEGVGIFLMEIVDIDDHQQRAFSQLGEVHPEVGAVITDLYVKSPHTQDAIGALPVRQTSGTTGRNVADAVIWDAFEAAGLPTKNIHVWFLDKQMKALMSGETWQPFAEIFMREGTSEQVKNRYRFDYPGRPGYRIASLLMGDQVTWTDEGDGATTGTGHIWSMTLPRAMFGSAHFLDVGTHGFCDYSRITPRMDSEAEMNAEPYGHWAASYAISNTYKIHLPLGETPHNRVWMSSTNATASCYLDVEAGHPRYIEVYNDRDVAYTDSAVAVPDGIVYKRGRNEASLTERQNWSFYRKGSAGQGGSSTIKPAIKFDMSGVSRDLAGPSFEGFSAEDVSVGLFYDRLEEGEKRFTSLSVTVGIYGKNVGGHMPEYANSDGHFIDFQGDCQNLSLRNPNDLPEIMPCTILYSGNPVAFYSPNNHTDGTNTHEEGDFSGMDISMDVLIQDHSPFWPGVGNGSSDVGFHFACDNDALVLADNASVVLSGLISGFRSGIRKQWSADVPVTTHAQDSLVVEKGSYAGNDSIGLYTSRSFGVQQVVLSSGTGAWEPGDLIEDPDTAGRLIGIVCEVINPGVTPTLYFLHPAGWGNPNTIANGDTVNNLTRAGSGIANGAEALAPTTITSSTNVDGIKFAADLDKVVQIDTSATPGGVLASRSGIGWRHRSVNITVVGQPTTGHFESPTHGTQDFIGFQGNVATGNTYLGGTSTNPAS